MGVLGVLGLMGPMGPMELIRGHARSKNLIQVAAPVVPDQWRPLLACWPQMAGLASYLAKRFVLELIGRL
jgi:hypothetical protein